MLGLISRCAMSDLAMLRWITNINSMGLEFHHILVKKNVMVNMLLREMYEGKNNMVLEDEDIILKFFNITIISVEKQDNMQMLNAFNESECDEEWLYIGRFLNSMVMDTMVCKFLLEDIISQYKCVGKIVVS